MSEPVDWLPDGTPYSPRFSDRYHSESGPAQARNVFLHGCGLPAAWAGQPQWRVLETGFGLGLNFLVTWAAWRADPARPRILHFTACEAWPVSADDLLRAAPQDPDLLPLATQLAAQFWGLLPGVHRLAFEDGRVLLTLYIGDAQAMLRQQQPVADSVYLDGFSPERNPDLWSPHTLRAVARCCRRGTRLATWTIARAVRDALAQGGFAVRKVPGLPPKRDNLQATFEPHWEPRASQPVLPDVAAPRAARCLVVGAGLAGSAVAASLARRGWQVHVLEEGQTPAAGASGLPAGVFAPHVSPDDSVLSRLSRAGVRTTLQTLAAALGDAQGVDWSDCGVLEHGVDGALPLAWSQGPGLDWSRPATPGQLAASHLPPDAAACWHARGGWVRPPRLVQRLLEQPGIHWHGGRTVTRLQRTATAWQALDAHGTVLAEAELAVVCAGFHSAPLIGSPWPLQPLRGQVAWGCMRRKTPACPGRPSRSTATATSCRGCRWTRAWAGWPAPPSSATAPTCRPPRTRPPRVMPPTSPRCRPSPPRWARRWHPCSTGHAPGRRCAARPPAACPSPARWMRSAKTRSAKTRSASRACGSAQAWARAASPCPCSAPSCWPRACMPSRCPWRRSWPRRSAPKDYRIDSCLRLVGLGYSLKRLSFFLRCIRRPPSSARR